jgi:hypothetical protein
MRGAALALGAAALSVMLLPAEGAPRILHFDGLGPVKIGMTARRAQQVLGAQFNLELPGDSDSKYCSYRWLKRDPGVLYMVESGRITRIDIVAPDKPAPRADVTTETGLRLGAPESDVRHAYGASLIVKPHPYDGEPAHYLIVEDKGRDRGLLFETDVTRHVTQFRVGRHPSLDYIEGCE